MGDSGLERLKRQLRELEAWISDLTRENRALRERLETAEGEPAYRSRVEAARRASAPGRI